MLRRTTVSGTPLKQEPAANMVQLSQNGFEQRQGLTRPIGDAAQKPRKPSSLRSMGLVFAFAVFVVQGCGTSDSGNSESNSSPRGGSESRSADESSSPDQTSSSVGGSGGEEQGGGGGEGLGGSGSSLSSGGASNASSSVAAGGAAPATTTTTAGGVGNTGGASFSANTFAAGGSTASSTTTVVIDRSRGLSTLYANYFPIGAAVSRASISQDSTRLLTHFNHLTAENAMKGGTIHPSESTWAFTEADEIANLARAQGWKLTGHTLVWHSQQPNWMFAGLTAGNADSIEKLKARMKSHIEGMVARYGDVVDNWDVVNEAISDDSAETYRSTGSQWYTIFGGPDFIYWAFRYTKEALEAQAEGSSAGKLYYNDYNETQKVDRILSMCDWLANHPSGGVRIDGIGLQAHYNLAWPSDADISATIRKIVDAGYKVKISELDMSVYTQDNYGTRTWQAQIPFTPELDAQLAARYSSLFEMLRGYGNNITSVTFWGIRDELSWLRGTPVSGRANYPLLWNSAGDKAALAAISNFDAAPVSTTGTEASN